MKTLITILFLLTPIFSYASRWVETGRTITAQFYVDTQSIQRNGNLVTFWERRNYVQRNKFGDLSTKANLVINCRTRESKLLFLITYDDFDNSGKVTTNTTVNQEWQPIAPDTIEESTMKFVCKR